MVESRACYLTRTTAMNSICPLNVSFYHYFDYLSVSEQGEIYNPGLYFVHIRGKIYNPVYGMLYLGVLAHFVNRDISFNSFLFTLRMILLKIVLRKYYYG